MEKSINNKQFSKAKSWFFEEINEIGKPLLKLIKEEEKNKLPVSEFKDRISLQVL